MSKSVGKPYLRGEIVEDLGEQLVGDAVRVLVVREAHPHEVVGAHEHVAHVLGLLHALPCAHRRPLRQDLGRERDEVL